MKKSSYPMLEGPLTADSDQQRLIINELSVKTRRYTGPVAVTSHR